MQFTAHAALEPGFPIRVKPPRDTTIGDVQVHVPWTITLHHGDLSLQIEGGAPDLRRLRDAIDTALTEHDTADGEA